MLPAMPMIPPELLPILIQLGIVDPSSSRWERREPWPLNRLRAHYFCPCGRRPDGQQQVELQYTTLAGRRIYIGQCPWCRTVYWREAVRE
jgi:hypothetical protein